MKKNKIGKVILLVLFLCLLGYTGYYVGKQNPEMEIEQGEEEEKERKRTFVEEDLQYSFQLINLRQEVLDLMGLEQEELANALAEWTYENGYSMATGAIFYSTLTIDYNTDSYMMSLRLLNDDVETVLNMEYYKDQRSLILKAIGPSVEYSE